MKLKGLPQPVIAMILCPERAIGLVLFWSRPFHPQLQFLHCKKQSKGLEGFRMWCMLSSASWDFRKAMELCTAVLQGKFCERVLQVWLPCPKKKKKKEGIHFGSLVTLASVLSECFFFSHHELVMKTLQDEWYIVAKAYKFTDSTFFCIITYCVLVLSLHIEPMTLRYGHLPLSGKFV